MARLLFSQVLGPAALIVAEVILEENHLALELAMAGDSPGDSPRIELVLIKGINTLVPSKQANSTGHCTVISHD